MLFLYIEISVGFDSSTYTVEEDVGVFSPELTLDRPSPCCITVLAELVNGTALGELSIIFQKFLNNSAILQA